MISVGDAAGERLGRLSEQIDRGRTQEQELAGADALSTAAIDDAAQRLEDARRPVNLIENCKVTYRQPGCAQHDADRVGPEVRCGHAGRLGAAHQVHAGRVLDVNCQIDVDGVSRPVLALPNRCASRMAGQAAAIDAPSEARRASMSGAGWCAAAPLQDRGCAASWSGVSGARLAIRPRRNTSGFIPLRLSGRDVPRPLSARQMLRRKTR